MRRMSGNSSVKLKRPLARGGIFAAFVTAALFACVAPAARAAEMLPGPVPADVLEVIDGDTVAVKARIWLGQDVVTHVRIAGIDAPESKQPKCPEEHEKAVAARDELQQILASRRVILTNVRFDKWGGRVLADVQTDGGESVKDIMLKSGHAQPYDGGARRDWCEKSQAER